MKRITLTFVSIFLVIGCIYSAFPVKKNSPQKSQTNTLESNNQSTNPSEIAQLPLGEDYSPAASSDSSAKWIALALWAALGGFAAHRWYAKKPVGWNILFIVTLGGLLVWFVIDGINILTGKFTEDM